MNYEEYQPEDFLMDNSFIQWVKSPTDELDTFWQDWLVQHPEKQATVMQARYLLQTLKFEPQFMSEEKLNTIQAAVNDRIDGKNRVVVRKLAPARHFAWAASLSALALLAGWLAYAFLIPAKQFYQTVSAETKEIVLPDNSTVTLNANSQLYYAENKETGDREVWLDGEAYFHVNRQNRVRAQGAAVARRFLVHTNQLDVVVLGTRFNVNNRRGETRVVLHSGKVLIQIPDQEATADTLQMVMKPGEMVSFAKNQKAISVEEVDPLKYIGWKGNLLVLDETPLHEVIHMLEDNFGYTVVLKTPELKVKTFSGTFPADDPEVLLQTISKSLNLEVSGKTLVIQ